MMSEIIYCCEIAIIVVIFIFVVKYEFEWFKKRWNINLEDIKTKEEDDEFTPDYEKVERAEEIIRTPQSIIPGLGSQNPIPPLEEEVEIDPKDMPWELKDAEDAKEE